jgi:hypothetical protein
MKKLTLLSTFVVFCTLALGGTVSADTYSNDFDSYADGTTDLLDGTVMAGTAVIQGGALQLTENGVAGGFASFSIPALANSSLGWQASFDLTISADPASNEPADGMSLNYGNAALGTLGAAEEGMGTGDASENLSFEIDTWMNLDEEQGVNISGNAGGTDVGQLAFTNGSILADGTTVTGQVVATWNPTDGATFLTTGLLTNAEGAAFTNVATSFTPSDAFTFIFSGRVGGANETKLIDNLFISTVPEPCGAALLGLGALGLLLRRRR